MDTDPKGKHEHEELKMTNQKTMNEGNDVRTPSQQEISRRSLKLFALASIGTSTVNEKAELSWDVVE